MTQTNLGVLLEALGAREDQTTRLEEAVAAFRAALTEFTRSRMPLRWAATQNDLGVTLARLGAEESNPALIEEGIRALRAALEEWTRERVPLDWAGTQFNLGIALAVLGMSEGGTAHLEEAVAAWDACLTVAEPVWPPERLRALRERRETVQSEIKRLSAR